MSAGCGDQGSFLRMIYSFRQTQGGHRQATMPTSQNGYGWRDQESKVVTSYSCNVFGYSGGYQMWTLHSLGSACEHPSPLKHHWGFMQMRHPASISGKLPLTPPSARLGFMNDCNQGWTAANCPLFPARTHRETCPAASPQTRPRQRFHPPRQEWNVLAET